MKNYSDTVIGGVIVIAPRNIPGRFRIDARSDLAMRVVFYGVYEPDVTEALSRLCCGPGLFVNIGANVGFFAIFAAKVLGFREVIAIEPNPAAFELLARNIEDNDLSQVINAHCKCIAQSRSEVEFAFVDGKPEYSSIGGIVHSGLMQGPVKLTKIDAVPLADVIGRQRVSLLFVDAEGSEETIFLGAEGILKRDRPILFFECVDPLLRKFGSNSRVLEERLISMGYAVRNGLNPSRRLVHPFTGEAVAHPAANLAP
jgi:FkbM family methyltransferase